MSTGRQALLTSAKNLGALARRLDLLYYEPMADIAVGDLAGMVDIRGFAMRFNPQMGASPLEPKIVPPLLELARGIVDLPNPPH